MIRHQAILLALLFLGCSTEPEKVYGCIDIDALNYNEMATVNNGSCEYIPFDNYSDIETIYSTDNGGNLIGILGDGIWGECQGKCEVENTWFVPFPNPFNPTTSIILNFPEPGYIFVQVYNVMNQVVATLFNGYMDVDTYTLNWDATNMPNGYYRVIIDFDSCECFANLLLEN